MTSASCPGTGLVNSFGTERRVFDGMNTNSIKPIILAVSFSKSVSLKPALWITLHAFHGYL